MLNLNFLKERISPWFGVCLMIFAFVLGAVIYHFDHQRMYPHAIAVVLGTWAVFNFLDDPPEVKR